MWLCLSALVVLEEIRKQHCRMAKMQGGPRNSRRKTACLELVFEAQSGLYAETSRNIWMIHKFVLLHGEVAVDW